MKSKIVVITHGTLAESLKKNIEMLLGETEDFFSIAFGKGDSIDELEEKVNKYVEKFSGSDILIFVDVFGGSCSNTAMRFIEKENVYLFSGVNVPQLLLATTMRDKLPIDILREKIVNEGKKAIIDIKEMWEKRKNV